MRTLRTPPSQWPQSVPPASTCAARSALIRSRHAAGRSDVFCVGRALCSDMSSTIRPPSLLCRWVCQRANRLRGQPGPALAACGGRLSRCPPGEKPARLDQSRSCCFLKVATHPLQVLSVASRFTRGAVQRSRDTSEGTSSAPRTRLAQPPANLRALSDASGHLPIHRSWPGTADPCHRGPLAVRDGRLLVTYGHCTRRDRRGPTEQDGTGERLLSVQIDHRECSSRSLPRRASDPLTEIGRSIFTTGC